MGAPAPFRARRDALRGGACFFAEGALRSRIPARPARAARLLRLRAQRARPLDRRSGAAGCGGPLSLVPQPRSRVRTSAWHGMPQAVGQWAGQERVNWAQYEPGRFLPNTLDIDSSCCCWHTGQVTVAGAAATVTIGWVSTGNLKFPGAFRVFGASWALVSPRAWCGSCPLRPLPHPQL